MYLTQDLVGPRVESVEYDLSLLYLLDVAAVAESAVGSQWEVFAGS